MLGNRHKGWIGIEWGAQTLRLAQVERDREGVRVVASAVASRSRPIGSQDPLSVVPDWSPDELRAAVRSSSFSGRSVACVLPMHLSDLRQLTIPPGSAAERYAMVSSELALAQGEASRNVLFDFWDAGGGSRKSPETVNAMSVPSDIVEEVVRTMTRAKLHCEVLDGLPFAMSRAVGLAFGRAHAPLAVFDWGRVSGTFCMVHHGMPVFTRHLRNCGLAKLLESVGHALALPESDVLETLAVYGLPGEKSDDDRADEIQAVIADAAGGPLHEVVEELRRTIAYMGTQHAEMSLERLCLTGECATIRHVDRFLASQLNVPVDVWTLPRASAGQGVVSESSMPHFASAIALSALAWTPEGTDVP